MKAKFIVHYFTNYLFYSQSYSQAV